MSISTRKKKKAVKPWPLYFQLKHKYQECNWLFSNFECANVYLLAVWLNYLTFLSLSFLICKIGVIMVLLW